MKNQNTSNTRGQASTTAGNPTKTVATLYGQELLLQSDNLILTTNPTNVSPLSLPAGVALTGSAMFRNSERYDPNPVLEGTEGFKKQRSRFDRLETSNADIDLDFFSESINESAADTVNLLPSYATLKELEDDAKAKVAAVEDGPKAPTFKKVESGNYMENFQVLKIKFKDTAKFRES